MSNKEKYFPIHTDTACKLKWTWSALYLDRAKSATCHRTAYYPLTVENFSDFHNNPLVISDRQNMLKGQWPNESCRYCKNIEDSGGVSDRLHMLSQPGLIPPELDSNPNEIYVTPRVLEIFINNVCNLSCLYCRGDLSSRINQENKKFGKFDKDGVILEEIAIDRENNLISSSLDWLSKNYHHLERLHFLGGEPLVQKELDLFLKFLQENKNSKLEVNIVTNLMVSEKKLKNYIQIFKQLIVEKRIRRLDITCSIDSWGAEQEFVRYGLNLTTWEKNFNFLLEIPWLVLHINQTITNLTIKQMPTLIEKLVEWRRKKNVGHYFSTVNPGPSYMIPSILGSEEFAEDFEKILKLMPRQTSEDQIKFEYMQGIANEYLQNAQIDQIEIKKLYTFLNEIDRRRSTDWQSTFPWLLKYKEYVV